MAFAAAQPIPPRATGSRSLWRRLWMNPSLHWGCEIAPTAVSVASWGRGSAGIEAAASRPLPDGLVDVSPLHPNIQRPDEARQALAACLQSLGRTASPHSGRAADAALVIPDQAARLFFLNFESLPRSASEALPLIRWRLKKSVPFDISTSTLSYFAFPKEGQWQVVAVVSPETIVRQYEELAESVGLKPRFVTLSTLATLGLLPARAGSGAEPRSVLLAKYSPPWFTTTIVHQGSVCLFRTVMLSEGQGDTIPVKDILEAVYPSVAYFQDNFGAPLQQAYLCGLGENTRTVAEVLNSELHLPADSLLAESLPIPPGWDSLQRDRGLASLLAIVYQRRRP